MGAVYFPIGGGRLDKVQAFDVLAHALNIEERPISAARLDIFRLVFDLGAYAFENGGQGQLKELVVWADSWDLLGCLYQGLANLENEAMAPIHAANQEQFLETRRLEAEAEDERTAAA